MEGAGCMRGEVTILYAIQFDVEIVYILLVKCRWGKRKEKRRREGETGGEEERGG